MDEHGIIMGCVFLLFSFTLCVEFPVLLHLWQVRAVSGSCLGILEMSTNNTIADVKARDIRA